MKLLLVWFLALVIAGVIISPFFWLRFLKQRGVWKYLIASSVSTLIFLFAYIYPIDSFLNNWTAKTNADWYYFYDDLNLYPILIVIFLISVSPFIFIKIIKGKFSWMSFFLALFLSCAVLASIFSFWALVLLPQAFSHLHDYF